ncbi:serine/threonine-protein kinase [Xenorhabdus bovienii]|uniref:serine/threonine-protein kinase n=1 Tax=Xenorhabdus bovienii TaxID=40576 RepID=UPI0023B22979|nr:serine/threonine-protein kinase [Xenorhabdus bovienii]MDE9455794.1 serine/threonine protein kinase [Xenorhabdus bovienii]MDE9564161.1 serine/threonine protein kinase [Xenorhabdus bovienii]
MITPYKKADVSFTWLRDLDEQGCFSRVYLAHDQNLDHSLVIKEIPKDNSQNKDVYFSEARLLYKNSHPNIVQIQYAAEDDENIYIAMPYYCNGTINQYMNNTNLTARDVIRYSIQFLSGLHHIHTKKLMHFDIKPNNIMLSDRNEAMLSDFGLSKLVGTTGRATPDDAYFFHMPPEYFTRRNDESFNYTYDIYQVGVTMYRMCVGSRRFNMELSGYPDLKLLSEAIIGGGFPAKNYQPNIPKRLISIINKCLEINPSNRYQAALDILNDLSAIKDGSLDWREIDTEDPSIQEWQKNVNDAILSVSYNLNQRSSIAKRLYPDGKSRRDSRMTVNNCTRAKIYSILKDN